MATYKKRSIKGIFAFFFLLFIVCGSLTTWSLSKSNANVPITENVIDNPSPTSALESNKYKIVIDPGHGGKDQGATGASGAYERQYTYSLALKVYELLEKEPMFEPRLTRTEDLFVELEDRADLANNWKADALLSIHGNTYTDPTVTGTESLYTYDNESVQLAQSVQHHMVKAMGFRDRGVKKEPLKILSLSEMPAVLIEIGYLTNAEEEAFMLSNKGQTLAAHAIVDGLKQFFLESQK